MNIVHDEDGTLTGADDLHGNIIIDLSDVEVEPVEGFALIGIEVEKDPPEGGNIFGYWARVINPDVSEEVMVDDFYARLTDLCDEYSIDADDVIDRIALELLRRKMGNE